MNLDGSGQTQLLTIAGEEFHPSYSTDGERIIYYSDVDGYHKIFIVDAVGGNPVALTDEPEGCFKTGTLIAP